MTDESSVQSVAWDLSDLYADPGDPRIVADLDAALVAAKEFARQYRGTIHGSSGPVAGVVAEAVARLEAIMEQVGKTCVYAELLHAADATPAAHGALGALTQEKASEIRQ